MRIKIEIETPKNHSSASMFGVLRCQYMFRITNTSTLYIVIMACKISNIQKEIRVVGKCVDVFVCVCVMSQTRTTVFSKDVRTTK